MMKLFNIFFIVIHGVLLFTLSLFPPAVPTAFWAMLDVGQGDALFIRTRSGANILIDTGPDSGVLYALDQVLGDMDRTIDLLFITHPHADHLNGALYVLDRYDVGGIVMSNVNYNSAQYALLKRKIREKNISLFEPEASLDWQLENGLVLDILFPFSPLDTRSFKNVNNSSLVMMLRANAYRMLLTGDMEEELELLLSTYYGAQLKAEGLKVGHHGSKTSSSSLLLNFVQPQENFISVGRNNSFHHPAPTTLDKLKEWGVISRTDEVGTITKILL